MGARTFGRVISIFSANGQRGDAGQSSYASAKSGDLGFTTALAQEGARAGIAVHAVCPGYIGTEMVHAIDEDVRNKPILPQIPIRRLDEPPHVARCVVFVASDDTRFIKGPTIAAIGGQYSS